MRIMKRWASLLVVSGMIILASTNADCGFEKSSAEKSKSSDDLYSKVEIFADALSIIRSEYADEVDSKKLIYGALRGMLESLDDYSQFMDPDEYDEIRIETKGEFAGIGVEISMKDGILTIITPMVGTPAEAAGIKAGDKIVKIDGKITKNMTLSDSIKYMRGKPGTIVKLTVWRDGAPSILEIAVKRDIIKVHSIKKAEMLEPKIGYIKLIEFQENTPKDLDAAIKKLRSAGMESLILDLRNNPGGLLDGAVDVAERFLAKDKVIVSIKSRIKEQNAEFKSSGKNASTDIKMAVIVNEGSASASEIVAGAIKDNKRGIVIGTKTFGKASVQTVIPLKDGSALRFTTAYYLTPSGKLIKGEGIMPDLVVEDGSSTGHSKDRELDIFEGLEEGKETKAEVKLPPKKSEKPEAEKKEKDNQLETAIKLMRAVTAGKAEKR